MSLKTYESMKSMVTTPDFEERLAAVNGVVVASKIQPGGQMHRKRPLKGIQKTTYICAICNGPCRYLRELRDHFVACVARNGNPNAACWDDCLTPDDISSLRQKSGKANINRARVVTSTMPFTDYEERGLSDKERLAAVDGIMIPSRLPAGKSPSWGTINMSSDRHVHPCSICGRKFVKMSHLRKHFPACVQRNGNPTAARWNSSLDNKARRTRMKRNKNSRHQNVQPEDTHPGSYGFDNVFDTPDLQTILSDPLQQSQLTADPESSFDFNDFVHKQAHYTDLQPVDPKLANPALNAVQPYNTQMKNISPSDYESYGPRPRMDVLTNGGLLSMFEAWQGMIRDGRVCYALEHPHSQVLMAELVERKILSAEWEWIVIVEELDMEFVRLVADGQEV